MNNKKGFTLIELLVTIALIAVVTISIGIGTSKTNENTINKQNRELLNDIFDSADVYTVLNMSTCDSGCTFKLKDLIESGLIDEKILRNNNPLTNSTFDYNLVIEVDFEQGQKRVSIPYIVKGTSKRIYSTDVDSFKDWEK